MLRRSLPLIVCGAALIVPASAGASGGGLTAARARAAHTLHKAVAVAHGRGVKTGRELTPLLKDLDVRMKYLTGAQKREATGLLLRPTLGQTNSGEAGYSVAEHDPPYCTAHFCIHWVDTTDDAPSLADDDHDGIPDYVETMDGVFEHVYDVENGQLGWRPPNPDGGLGGNDKVDVYIKQLGPSQIFGYSAPDPGQRSNSQHAYLVMDNDYRQSEYPRYSNPLPPMEVTAAHEYNHVLQFGYDVLQDTWLFESTAVWMEDKVYDDVNDYLSYLTPWSQLGQVPLTRFNSSDSTDPYNVKVYGDAVFPRFVDSHFGADAIRGVWEQSLNTTPPSFAPAAYDRSLRLHGATGGFFDVFTDFVAHLPEWRATADGFRDGNLFPDMQRVRTSLRVNGPGLAGALDHTSFALMNVQPTTSSRIKLFGGAPKGDEAAIALVGRTGDDINGTPTIALKRLPKGGDGSVVLDNAPSFSRITVVLVNADATQAGFSNALGDWVFKRDGEQVFARVSTDFTAPTLRKRSGSRTKVKLQFSEAVGNVSSRTISLLGPGGHHVRARVHYDSRSHRVTITPTRSLHGGTRYTVHIGGGIVDNGGNLLPQSQRQFTFTARS
ncbi:MAG: Ig-like domain-containing protein [Thermoleophilaceae bacterium]|jgi:hypothetical protein